MTPLFVVLASRMMDPLTIAFGVLPALLLRGRVIAALAAAFAAGTILAIAVFFFAVGRPPSIGYVISVAIAATAWAGIVKALRRALRSGDTPVQSAPDQEKRP